jgi:hypothetical protein
MLTLPLTLVVAIVTQDATPLRAAAKDTAARQTLLYAGDWLELRGERQGYLQVYNHRHERPGYVRPAQVRTYAIPDAGAGAARDATDGTSARELAAIIDFVRDTPGQEALGIGYAALFLRAAPAGAVGAELFDALGAMAERLGRRASSRWARPGDAALAGALEVAESYGVHFHSFERDGRARVCYDGEAFRRVLALPASAAARARAALGLTEPACVDPALAAADRGALVAWQADVLAKAEGGSVGTNIPMYISNKLRIRRAEVQAELAHARARQGDWAAAATAATEATRALALVEQTELADEDTLGYEAAAVRVGAVRWAAEGAAAPARPGDGRSAPAVRARGLTVTVAAGTPGQTCVHLADGTPRGFDHCTYAVVWPASLQVAPRGDAVTLAQSPLPGWCELVLLRRGRAGWEAQTLAPAAIDPELGYVEAAGSSPDGTRLLVAREAVATGPLGQPGTQAPWLQRSFQILRADDLAVEKQAARLDHFVSFRRWESPGWRRSTVALR